MHQEFIRELANIINKLSDHRHLPPNLTVAAISLLALRARSRQKLTLAWR